MAGCRYILVGAGGFSCQLQHSLYILYSCSMFKKLLWCTVSSLANFKCSDVYLLQLNRFALRYSCSLPGMNYFDHNKPHLINYSHGSNPSESVELLQMRRSPYIVFNYNLLDL